MEPSNEQDIIINNIINKNIVVNAVAGSGKSTTACFIGKKYYNKNILFITYNKKLRYENIRKVRDFGLTNVNVFNYHSFCFHKYLIYGNTDEMIDEAIKKNEHKTEKKFKYDIIIVEEAQDITPLYFQLLKMIIKHNSTGATYCIIGDTMQTIYQYNGADERFMTMANDLFPSNERSWMTCTLSITYRLTRPMCSFINNVVLQSNEPILHPHVNDGTKPRYLFCDAFGDRVVNEIIHYYFGKCEYKNKDILIISPSIQSDLSPIKMLANRLSAKHNIPIYIPTSDNDKIDDESAQDKIIIATYHQVKGIERKAVIVFGFDNSYFYYYNNDAPRNRCPNDIYVALTRATRHMTLVHHYRKNFIDFINSDLIGTYCYVEKVENTGLVNDQIVTAIPELMDKDAGPVLRTFDMLGSRPCRPVDIIMDINDYDNSLNKTPKLSVTSLLSRIPIITLTELMKRHITIHKLVNTSSESMFDSDDEDEHTDIRVNDSVKNDNFVVIFAIDAVVKENVSDIIGTALPIIYDYKVNKRLTIKRHIENILNSRMKYGSSDIYYDIKARYTRIKNLVRLKASDLFELVTIHMCLTNNLIHRVRQISNYSFLTNDVIDMYIKRFKNHIGGGAEFEVFQEAEVEVEVEGYEIPIKRSLMGYIDCIDDNTVWEFKNVQNIKTEHLAQLAIYAFLYNQNYGKPRTFKLLNTNDGTRYTVEGNYKDFVHDLFRVKFQKPKHISDEEFKELNV
jgi:hypothetical protein